MVCVFFSFAFFWGKHILDGPGVPELRFRTQNAAAFYAGYHKSFLASSKL